MVAPEFCMLTEWPLEDLLGAGRKKYIYEVLSICFVQYCKANFILGYLNSSLKINQSLNTGKILHPMLLRTQRTQFILIVFC